MTVRSPFQQQQSSRNAAVCFALQCLHRALLQAVPQVGARIYTKLQLLPGCTANNVILSDFHR